MFRWYETTLKRKSIILENIFNFKKVLNCSMFGHKIQESWKKSTVGFQPLTRSLLTLIINIQITQSSNCISQFLSTCQFIMIKSLKYEQYNSFRFLLNVDFTSKTFTKKHFYCFYCTYTMIVVKCPFYCYKTSTL